MSRCVVQVTNEPLYCRTGDISVEAADDSAVQCVAAAEAAQ